jgi:hypothetical protein
LPKFRLLWPYNFGEGRASSSSLNRRYEFKPDYRRDAHKFAKLPEGLMTSEPRYVDGDVDGWRRVKLDSGEEVSLPHLLRVWFKERRNDRDYFHIDEGTHYGRGASVMAQSTGMVFGLGASSYLKTPMPKYRGAAVLTLYRETAKLHTPIGTMDTVIDTREFLKPGMHPIQIPDDPKPDMGTYIDQGTKKAAMWFYLRWGRAVKGKRDSYLHVGRRTNGCVTVADLRWDQLCDYLLTCRVGDNKNVGWLRVVPRPGDRASS